MALYDEYADLRDRFEILAFHDNSVRTLAEVDEQLARNKTIEFWNGRKLPFPVLIDDSDKTITTWGISGFPTAVLIDPEGNVARGGSEAFEAQLKKLKADSK